MPKQFADLFNDFYGTTGNLGSYSSGIGDNRKSGGLNIYENTVGVLTDDRLDFETSIGKATDGYGMELFVDQAKGLRSYAGINASRGYMGSRLKQTSDLYSNFVDESNRFGAEMDMLAQASDVENETYANLQLQLDASKAKLQGSSSASSLGAYSAAAKRQMQETSRTLNSLKNVKAAPSLKVDTSFINPLTGKRAQQDEEFNPENTDIDALTESMVRQDYKDRQNRIIDELSSAIKTETNFSSNEMFEGSSYNEYLKASQEVARQTTQGFAHYNDREGLLESRMKYNENEKIGDSNFTWGHFSDFESARTMYSQTQTFAESRALAEMAGMEEGYSGKSAYGKDFYMTGSQLFQDADRDAILGEMISDTQTKFKTQEYKDTAALAAEFEKRKGLAVSQANDVTRRNQLNAARAENSAEKARQYSRLLEQQQQEYQSTLSSASAVETSGGGVTFKDIRPV